MCEATSHCLDVAGQHPELIGAACGDLHVTFAGADRIEATAQLSDVIQHTLCDRTGTPRTDDPGKDRKHDGEKSVPR